MSGAPWPPREAWMEDSVGEDSREPGVGGDDRWWRGGLPAATAELGWERDGPSAAAVASGVWVLSGGTLGVH